MESRKKRLRRRPPVVLLGVPTGVVKVIVAQADGLHPQAKAEMDKYLYGYSGPVQEDPRYAFLALVAAYTETAFGIGFAMGHSAEVPAIRPMVEAFIEKLKRDGVSPQPEILGFWFRGFCDCRECLDR